MQVGLDVAAIIIISFIGFGSVGENIAKDWFLISIFINSQAMVTGGRNSNSTTSSSATVA